MMKLFVNQRARRFFVVLLALTLGFSVLTLLCMLVVSIIGFEGVAFRVLLVLNFAFFSPVHVVLGNAIVPVQEFGPNPGTTGYFAAICFYSVASYVLANAGGATLRERAR